MRSGYDCEGYKQPLPEPSAGQPGLSVLDTIPTAGGHFTDLDSDPCHADIHRRLLAALSPHGPQYVGSNALAKVLMSGIPPVPSALVALETLESLMQMMTCGQLQFNAATRVLVTDQYGHAMRLLSAELGQGSEDSNRSLVTCLLLTAIELLQRRRQNAIKHVLGGVLQSWSNPLHPADGASIHFLLRVFDLQTLLYSTGVRLPRTEASNQPTYMERQGAQLENFERQAVIVLHSAHSVIAETHHQAVSTTVPDHQVDRQQHIERLLLLIDAIEATKNAGIQKGSAYPVWLMMQNLCWMTVMQLRQLNAVDELSWDVYVDYFEAIVGNVDSITDMLQSRSGKKYPLFTLQVGIIPPLSLVAFKCRHPSLRRRAIVHLRQAGQEGPFIGPLLAAVADRVMQIEEPHPMRVPQDGSQSSSSVLPEAVSLPAEADRLTKCWTIEDNGRADDNEWPTSTIGTTTIRCIRRMQPCSALYANVVTSSHFKTGSEFQTLADKELDPELWEDWTEQIRFSR